jgi:hypothetical protein
MTMPEKNAPLTAEEMSEAADYFFPLFEIVNDRMPKQSKIEDVLKVMENVAKLAQKSRADNREKEVKEKFGFNKNSDTSEENNGGSD